MIEYQALNSFCDLIESDLEATLLERKGSVLNYEKYIRKHYFDLMEESRNNLIFFNRIESKIAHFRDMIRKVIYVENQVFQKNPDNDAIIYRRYNMEIDRYGNELHKVAYILYDNIQETKRYFQTHLPEDSQLVELPRSGFTLYNRHIDHVPVFRMLVDRNIISEASENAFYKVFWAGVFEEPIIWLGGNGLLMYFIRQLERRGVVRPLGKTNLNSTILCFRNDQGEEYTKGQLQRSKVPKDKLDIDIVLNSFR